MIKIILSVIGGLIVDYFHPASINPYIFLFIVAAVLRGGVALFFLPQIKEVRKVRRVPMHYNLFFHPLQFLHYTGIRIIHLPGRVVGKFKNLRLFTP